MQIFMLAMQISRNIARSIKFQELHFKQILFSILTLWGSVYVFSYFCSCLALIIKMQGNITLLGLFMLIEWQGLSTGMLFHRMFQISVWICDQQQRTFICMWKFVLSDIWCTTKADQSAGWFFKNLDNRRPLSSPVSWFRTDSMPFDTAAGWKHSAVRIELGDFERGSPPLCIAQKQSFFRKSPQPPTLFDLCLVILARNISVELSYCIRIFLCPS